MKKIAFILLIFGALLSTASAGIPSPVSPATTADSLHQAYSSNENDPHLAGREGRSSYYPGGYQPSWGAYRQSTSSHGLLGSRFNGDLLEIFTSNEGSFFERLWDFVKTSFFSNAIKGVGQRFGFLVGQKDQLSQMASLTRQQQMIRILQGGGRILPGDCNPYSMYSRNPYNLGGIFPAYATGRAPAERGAAQGQVADNCGGAMQDYGRYGYGGGRVPTADPCGPGVHPAVCPCVGDNSPGCQQIRSRYGF